MEELELPPELNLNPQVTSLLLHLTASTSTIATLKSVLPMMPGDDFALGIWEERFRQLEEELEAVHKKKQKADAKVARAGSTFCTVVYYP